MRHLKVFLCASALVFAACESGDEGNDRSAMNGADGQGGSGGVGAVLLAQTQGDAPLEACANGGVIVGFGVDTNTNDELDEDDEY